MPTWRKKIRRGGLFIFSGALIAILPLLVALASGIVTGYSPFTEGSGSGGVLWLLFITVPVGFVTGIVGLFYIITGLVKYRGQLESE